MTIYKVKIKSAITEWLWYSEKIGETYEGEKHHTDSLFWFPGDVFSTPYGYIHEQDAEILSERESPIPTLQNN